MPKKPTYEELEQRIRDFEKAESERQQAEDELQNKETIIQSIFDAAPVGICIMKNRVYQRANRDWCESFGYRDEDLIGRTTAFLYESPEEYERVGKELYQDLLKNGIAFARTRLKRSDGVLRDVDLIAKPLNSYDLKAGTVVVIHDITERKQAITQLRESEEKFRLAMEATKDGLWDWNVETGEVYFNKAWSNILSEQSVEPKYYSWENRIHPDDTTETLSSLQHHLDGKNPNWQQEHRLKTKERDWKWVLGRGRVVKRDKDGKPLRMVGTMTDISERKQVEAKLRESEEKLARANRMESLGLLAGGVAHDLNNVLSGIVSYPDLLLMNLPEDSTLKKPIETIRESGNRAAAIVQDLLTVARGVAVPKTTLNLNNVIEDYLISPELQGLKQYHPGVTIFSDLDRDLFNINGSSVHIQKIVMNMVANATEAVRGSGKVVLSTQNRYIDRPISGYEDVNIGEYAVLSVSDDGFGIASDDIKRIFEPFYTKKVMGKSGTGLGLAVVWNAVQDHNGYIDVESNDTGTTFELYFPITRNEISANCLTTSINDYIGNGESILVVDDVESQRDISCRMLEVLGYKTKAVSSGEEAIAFVKENVVDLVILDMIMDPGINGRETYERIINIRPEQKAIIASGFAETNDVKEAQKLGAGRFLKKPITLKKMGAAVKEGLGK